MPRLRLAGTLVFNTLLSRSLLVAEIIVIIAQQRRILAIAQVLLKTAFALGIDVALASEKREQHREKD